MTSDDTFAGRLRHLFALYARWTAGGMLTFFIFYETCVGAFWLVGPAPGRATDVDVVRVVVVAVAAVLAELIALGMILGARWRARIDFSIIGHSMHLGFGGRGEATETHPH